MDAGRADEGSLERRKNGRKNFVGNTARTLTGQYINGRRKPGKVEGRNMDAIRSADGNIFATF